MTPMQTNIEPLRANQVQSFTDLLICQNAIRAMNDTTKTHAILCESLIDSITSSRFTLDIARHNDFFCNLIRVDRENGKYPTLSTWPPIFSSQSEMSRASIKVYKHRLWFQLQICERLRLFLNHKNAVSLHLLRNHM